LFQKKNLVTTKEFKGFHRMEYMGFELQMQLLKSIELENYLNIKHAKLEDFKDLNIIIGPNNCGKTSLLKALRLLSKMHIPGTSYLCGMCRTVSSELKHPASAFPGLQVTITPRERYLENTAISVIFSYYKSEVEKLLPQVSKREKVAIDVGTRADESVEQHLKSEFEKEQLVMKEKPDNLLVAEHISHFNWIDAKKKILDQILYCPDERLQSYKERNIPDHIGSKNLNTSAQRRLIELLSEIVDLKIVDIRHSLELERDVEDQRFTTSIAEQGSGVKSLICLVTDILSERQNKILLIDEPELGLNPSGKHAFLEFLLDESNKKQVFLATHDPTFVNPVLWNRKNVSVYLFSMVNNDFVKVDLTQSKQDPNTFAGYLPHTTSLKKAHIYVEGKNDVYIFQIFLRKYLRGFRYGYRILNEIGIFHLAGDFWSHLLYTIPKKPYTSIVVLDGDKKPIAEKVVNKYSTIEKDRFQIFDSLKELRNMSRRKTVSSRPCPIYCLQRSKIEDYLETKLKTKPISKELAPLVADKMNKVPTEIEWIFDLTLQLAGIYVPKWQSSED